MHPILKALILSGLLSATLPAASTRFVHTGGKHIVAPDGSKLLLRGICITKPQNLRGTRRA
jgi:hypothetical protein